MISRPKILTLTYPRLSRKLLPLTPRFSTLLAQIPLRRIKSLLLAHVSFHICQPLSDFIISDSVPVVVPDNGMAPTCICLPYSLVPNMDISSMAYQRAISVLIKQHHCLPHGPIPCSRLDSKIFQALANLGPSSFFFSFLWISKFLYFLRHFV